MSKEIFTEDPIKAFVAGDDFEPQALAIEDGSTWEDYCNVKAMNGSTLEHGRTSMLHLKQAIDSDFQPTPAMKLGTVAHCLLLEPDEFEKRFVVVPDFHLEEGNQTKDGKKSESKATKYVSDRLAKFAIENTGREFVTRQQYDDSLAMIESVRANPSAAMWLDAKETRKEVTVIGEIEGVICKGRIDILNPHILVDLKTARDARQHQFGKYAYNSGYLFKQAIHRELVRQMTGKTLRVAYAVVENTAPFDCVFYPIEKQDEQVFDQEFEKARALLRQYRKCLDTDHWPGIAGEDGELPFYVPDYAMDGEFSSFHNCEVVEL